MSLKKSLLMISILVISISASIGLIWQGLNLDYHTLLSEKSNSEAEVLGNRTEPQDFTESSVSGIQKKYLVKKVIDGDTFEFESDGALYKVRLIGIDTPETVDPRRPVGCFGKNASEETKRLLEGNEVILTKDISETDKYNRLLRYVFLPLSGGENLFINDYLVRQGFANASSYPPDIKYTDRFAQAEQEARDNLRGLWSDCK